jgi:MFS family permease
MLRRLAGRPRVTGMALAAAGWAVTFAAVIASSHLARAAVAQIIFAATMISVAMGETLLSSAVTVIIDYRTPPGAVRYKGFAALTFVTCCLLGPSAGGAALGAGWGTSLLTALAVACALASIAAHRLGRLLAPVAGPRSHPVRQLNTEGSTHPGLTGGPPGPDRRKNHERDSARAGLFVPR